MILSITVAVLIVLFVILIKHFTKERTRSDDITAVILIARNEEDSLEYTVRRMLAKFPCASVRIIDDGSEDDTAEIAARLAADYSRVEFMRVR